jgi:hypothetical protein
MNGMPYTSIRSTVSAAAAAAAKGMLQHAKKNHMHVLERQRACMQKLRNKTTIECCSENLTGGHAAGGVQLTTQPPSPQAVPTFPSHQSATEPTMALMMTAATPMTTPIMTFWWPAVVVLPGVMRKLRGDVVDALLVDPGDDPPEF